MKKIGFIKYGGLSSGGTEVGFQNIAVSLSEKYEVDYLYCDSSPYIGSDWVHPDTDDTRKNFVEKSNVNLIKFNVRFKDVTDEFHKWVDTNFWDVFVEDDYDLIFITTAGKSEYPFTKINETPIINIVTVNAGVTLQDNIYKTILITQDSAKTWLKQGGNNKKYDVIPVCREELFKTKDTFREELNLQQEFIFGFHQRNDDLIFSDVPLKAFKKVENDNNFFFMLGGSKNYSKQAEELKIKNFIQLESTSNPKIISKFLNTLDVFTHGRKHGETMGLVIVEGMFFGLPVVSHRADSNGHKEVIGNAGRVFSRNNVFSYAKEMKKLSVNKDYYRIKSDRAFKRYKEEYSTNTVIEKYKELINEVL